MRRAGRACAMLAPWRRGWSAIVAVIALVVVAALGGPRPARDRPRSERRVGRPARRRPGRGGQRPARPGRAARGRAGPATRRIATRSSSALEPGRARRSTTGRGSSAPTRPPTRCSAAHPGTLLGRTLIEAFLDTQVEAIAQAALEVGLGDRRGRASPAPTGRGSCCAPGAHPCGGLWLVLEDVSELRRLQQIRAEFIDNLSHELRTPLTTVSLLAETLTREAEAAGDAVPPRMRDRIGKIEVETGHLVQMVNELLDLSRIESGGALGVVDLLDLGQVATESTERLRLFADRQGVTLRVDVAGAGPAGPGRRGSGSGRSSSTCSTTR